MFNTTRTIQDVTFFFMFVNNPTSKLIVEIEDGQWMCLVLLHCQYGQCQWDDSDST